jgi:hypothetical protein
MPRQGGIGSSLVKRSQPKWRSLVVVFMEVVMVVDMVVVLVLFELMMISLVVMSMEVFEFLWR